MKYSRRTGKIREIKTNFAVHYIWMDIQEKNLEEEIKSRRKKQWESSRKSERYFRSHLLLWIIATSIQPKKKFNEKIGNFDEGWEEAVRCGMDWKFTGILRRSISHIYYRNYIYHRNIFIETVYLWISWLWYHLWDSVLWRHLLFNTIYF